MRVTQHSGRYSGGVQKHNDREFDLKKASHIDYEKMQKNVYVPCYSGMTFAEAEQKFYEENFKEMIDDINLRAEASRHKERQTSASKLLSSKKTMPEEVIFQIGDIDQHVDIKVLGNVFKDFYKWHQKEFGEHVHTLNIAYHIDEKTPHIHLRRVWTYEHEKGFKAIGQHKALLQMGYTLPDESKERGRFNNLKQQYTADCRQKWLDICLEHGLEIEKTPQKKLSSQKNLKKNDYIISKQNEKIQEQEKKLLDLKTDIDFAKKTLTKIAENSLNDASDKKISLPEPKKTPLGVVYAKDGYSVLENTFKRLEAKIEALTAKNLSLQIENFNLKQENLSLKTQNTVLAKENENNTKTNLYQQITSLKHENWELSCERAEYKEKLKILKENFSTKEYEFSKRIKSIKNDYENLLKVKDSQLTKTQESFDEVLKLLSKNFNVPEKDIIIAKNMTDHFNSKQKNKEQHITPKQHEKEWDFDI